jgi:hypothetical protein
MPIKYIDLNNISELKRENELIESDIAKVYYT